ncbi:MAG: hemin uptake protein HemP [Pirellulales bacterium]
MNLDRPNSSTDLPSAAQPAKAPLRRMFSGDLFQGAREVQIEHHGEVYRLLETRNGKLILQK